MLNTFFVELEAFILEARKKTLSQFFQIKLFFNKYNIFLSSRKNNFNRGKSVKFFRKMRFFE